MKKKTFAFTLAEVMITLGVLGVVTAITIPVLSDGYQKRTLATQLKKVYSETTQCLQHYMNENNALNLIEAGLTTTEASVQSFTNKNFRILKNCGTTGTGCFATSYKSMSGSGTISAPTGKSCFVTTAGVSMCMDISTTATNQSSGVGVIYIDVNGNEGPNILGRDAFSMYIYPDGTLDTQNMYGCKEGLTACAYDDASAAREAGRTACKNSVTTWANASQCFGILINDDWEMKY